MLSNIDFRFKNHKKTDELKRQKKRKSPSRKERSFKARLIENLSDRVHRTRTPDTNIGNSPKIVKKISSCSSLDDIRESDEEEFEKLMALQSAAQSPHEALTIYRQFETFQK